jgi:hypothetical protein
MTWKDHWTWMNPSHHIGLLGWDRVYICSDVVDFLKSSRTDPAIRLVLISIRVETEYRSISRSLSGWGPKGEPNTPITAKSKMTDLLRLLKLIWQPDLSMLAIGVETEYRSVTTSLSGWASKGEPNAPIVVTPRCYRSNYSTSTVASTVFIQRWLQYKPNSMKMVFSTNGVGSFWVNLKVWIFKLQWSVDHWAQSIIFRN